MSEKQTVAGAFLKIESHEALCAERYERIHEAIGDLKGSVGWATRAVWGACFALLCWMGIQLYDANNQKIQAVSVQVQGK